MTSPVAAASVLATRRGKLILALLCAIGFLDFVDASIVNIALPSIKADLKFSVQNLQWVISGYLLTYGGFMLLGGRAADLIGRRRVLLAGTLVFGIASLTGGLAVNAGMLVGARLMQGVAAAMMVPAPTTLPRLRPASTTAARIAVSPACPMGTSTSSTPASQARWAASTAEPGEGIPRWMTITRWRAKIPSRLSTGGLPVSSFVSAAIRCCQGKAA